MHELWRRIDGNIAKMPIEVATTNQSWNDYSDITTAISGHIHENRLDRKMMSILTT